MKQLDFFKLPFSKGITYRGRNAVPFNHYCDDTSWLVIVMLSDWSSLMVQVTALDPQEAARKAIDLYLEEVEYE